MFSDGVVALAPFERADLPLVQAWVNGAELCRAIDRVLPVTALEHEHWYETLIQRPDAVTKSAEPAGARQQSARKRAAARRHGRRVAT